MIFSVYDILRDTDNFSLSHVYELHSEQKPPYVIFYLTNDMDWKIPIRDLPKLSKQDKLIFLKENELFSKERTESLANLDILYANYSFYVINKNTFGFLTYEHMKERLFIRTS